MGIFNPKCLLYGEDGGKITQCLAVLSATWAVFICGIQIGWPGPSLKIILSDEYPFEVSQDEASYIAIISPVGDIIGGFTGAMLMDKIGRHKTLLSLVIPQCLSFISFYLSSYSVTWLYFGRVFGGVAEGGTFSILTIYISEVAAPDVRGLFGTFISMTLILGKLFINIVGSYVSIQNTGLICLIFSFLFFITFIHMPETPYYLLMSNQRNKAIRALQMLRRTKDIDKELLILESDVRRQMSESGKYNDLFRIKSNRKAFILVNLMIFFQQFSGCTAFSMYTQILLQEGTDLSPILGSSIIIAVQLVANTIATFIVDRFGRKPLFIFSTASCSLMLFALGTFFALKEHTTIDLSNVMWVPLLFLILFIMSFQTGLGMVSNIFIGEIYSTSIKSKALSLGIIISSSCMMLSTKFYQITADSLGLTLPFYAFGVITTCGVLFFIFVLPETKGKSLEQIQQELKGNK